MGIFNGFLGLGLELLDFLLGPMLRCETSYLDSAAHVDESTPSDATAGPVEAGETLGH